MVSFFYTPPGYYRGAALRPHLYEVEVPMDAGMRGSNGETEGHHHLGPGPCAIRREQDTRVVMDASKVGLGAVLEQRHEEGWRPIAFWSRKLRDPETRYSATDLEWMAVVNAVTKVWY